MSPEAKRLAWQRARGVLVNWSKPELVLAGIDAAMARSGSKSQNGWRIPVESISASPVRRVGFEYERATARMIATNLTLGSTTDWVEVVRADREAPILQTKPMSSERFHEHAGMDAEKLLRPIDFSTLFSVIERAPSAPFRRSITLRWIDQAEAALERPFPTAIGGDEFTLELDTSLGIVQRVAKYVGREIAESVEIVDLEIE